MKIGPRQEDRFSDPKRLSSSGLLKQRPNLSSRADLLVYQARNKTLVTRIVGFTLFVEWLIEQDVPNIF